MPEDAAANSATVTQPVVEIKRSHKCFWYGCDVRLAVVRVNAFTFGILILLLMGAPFSGSRDEDNFDDDLAYPSVTGWKFSATIIVILIRIFFNVFAIGGALDYRQYLVGVGLVAYIADFILLLTTPLIAGAVIPLLFAYPHVVLIKEIRDGTMSSDTYDFEAQKCCGV
jgi:hypothetical protein